MKRKIKHLGLKGTVSQEDIRNAIKQNKSMEKLTVKQALEQGYEYYGIDSDSFQRLCNIKELQEEDFSGRRFLLAEKDPQHFITDKEDIRGVIAEYCIDQYYDITRDDDIEHLTIDLWEKLPVDNIVKVINSFFEEHWYRGLTNIELIWG